MLLSLRNKVFYHLARAIKSTNLHHTYRYRRQRNETPPFKLVVFCGAVGIDYLNAMLVSVLRNWTKVPEIVVISDGTPATFFEKRMIKWPEKSEVISWKVCASYFEKVGQPAIYDFACGHIFGKKLAGILYCAKSHPVLYCDTDVLWFNYPAEIESLIEKRTKIAMSVDVEHSYDLSLIKALQSEAFLKRAPLCAGVLYINGSFTEYPAWDKFSRYIHEVGIFQNFTEQTFFSILNNQINPGVHLSSNSILMKTDDRYSLDYTLKKYPGISARHYVDVKDTTFWRDYLYMTFKKMDTSEA